MRLLLGVGESVAYPTYSRILAAFPRQRRGLANAAIDAGTRTGPAVGTLLGGLLMAGFGWRVFFLALGLGSMLWLVAWLFVMPDGRSAAAKDKGEAPSVIDILRQRSAWFTFLGTVLRQLLLVLPGDLASGLPAKGAPFPGRLRWRFWEHWRFSRRRRLASCPAGSPTVGSPAAGRQTLVRRAFAGAGLALATIIVPVAFVRDDRLAMAFLITACAFIGMWSSNVWAITQTLAGPHAAGKWCAVQNGVGNLAGVAAPWLTGWVVGRTGHFSLAFVVASLVALTGSTIYVFGLGAVKQVSFSRR